MRLISFQEIQQDTVLAPKVAIRDTLPLKTDSASHTIVSHLKDSVPHRVFSAPVIAEPEVADTTSVCARNSIADITFYDSTNFLSTQTLRPGDNFPFAFTAKNKKTDDAAVASLVKQLRPGSDLPVQPLHQDWMIVIILVSAFIFSYVRISSKSLLPWVTRFFLFRGINDPSSRDIGGLFHWQSTLLNLISFFIFGLYGYSAVSYFGDIPSSLSGIRFWIIVTATVISAVTLRHFICLITGSASGERETFSEYLLGVYQFYRFSALFLFIVVVLMSYTTVVPVKLCLSAGIFIIGILYLIRIMRLLIIFINRSISIFYLILYLCALEILPVVISVKYISGLV